MNSWIISNETDINRLSLQKMTLTDYLYWKWH